MSREVTLTLLVDDLEHSGSDKALTIDEVLTVIGERGFGPLVLIMALLVLLPTGAVPGVPTACGLCIVLIAGQLVVGKRRPWLPARLRRLSIDRMRYKQVAGRIKPWTRRVDRLVKPRLSMLTDGVMARLIGVVMVVVALCMPPLELLPFAAAGPAFGLVLTSLGLVGRDGLWVLIGLVPAVASFALVGYVAVDFF
ncbi:exopolysaccharide biosynthesis protein [Salinisphaera sp. USBA-960]|nr:exopolysaccharide biosynthesis protein [Salifodinibacter halophilus]NNC26343.1 exopolysaccharide biosynthesis protein [Salifodinibacter halophilus]